MSSHTIGACVSGDVPEMCGFRNEGSMKDGPLHVLTDGVADSLDAEASEDRSTNSIDTHASRDDPEACAMDAKDILEDETVGEFNREAWNGETRGAMVLMMGAVIDVMAEAVEAIAQPAGGIVDVCIPVGMLGLSIVLEF